MLYLISALKFNLIRDISIKITDLSVHIQHIYLFSNAPKENSIIMEKKELLLEILFMMHFKIGNVFYIGYYATFLDFHLLVN